MEETDESDEEGIYIDLLHRTNPDEKYGYRDKDKQRTGDILMTCGANNTSYMYSKKTGKVIITITYHHYNHMSCCHRSRNGLLKRALN